MTGQKSNLNTSAGPEGEQAAFDAYNSPSAYVSMLVVILAAGASVATLPGVVGAFVSAHRVSLGQAPILGAVEPAGITVAMLLAATLPATIDRRAASLLAILSIAFGQIASAWVRPLDLLLATRFALGCAEGVLFTMVTATIGCTRNPERLFGVNFALNLIIASTFYAALTRFAPQDEVAPVMFALGLLALAAGVALPWFPQRPPKPTLHDPAPPSPFLSGQSGRSAGLVLCASFLLYIGIGAVWPLITLIGRQQSLAAPVITGALSTASLVGIAGGVFASWLGARFGRAPPMLAGTAGISLSMGLLMFPESAALFATAVSMFMGCWIFIGPFYLGAISALDPSGRLTAVTLAVQMLGLTVGQGMVALLVPAGAFASATLCAIVLSLLAIAIVSATLGLRRSPGTST